jgi:flagellar basal-body rod protein FlgC
MNISPSLQALDAVAIQLMVTANNVANVNTEEFRASRVDLEDGHQGQGVRVADIRRRSDQGPQIPDNPERLAAAGYATASEGWIQGSNTDLAVELTWLMREEGAYTANLRVMRTAHEMAGNIIELTA